MVWCLVQIVLNMKEFCCLLNIPRDAKNISKLDL